MESKSSYLSTMVKNARKKRNLNAEQVYSGICSEATYARFEGGDFNVNIHIRGAIMQRLGINESRGGICINVREYAELDDREHLLEYIGMGKYRLAEEKLNKYKNTYSMKNRMNRQFADYVQARLEYIDGNKKKSLELYESAIKYTMSQYETCESIVCISVYEAYIICEIAVLLAELGDKKRAEKIYMKIIRACQEGDMDRWIKCRIYPKAASGILRITNLCMDDINNLEKLFDICDGAIESLRKTGRIYFLRELLTYRNRLCIYLRKDTENEYNEFLECLDNLYSKYNIREHDYEWYPYYINDIFYPVEKVINERRIACGITVEELAGTELDVGTVSRIINGKNMPRRSTIDILFKRLGMEGLQYCDTIVSDDAKVHELWEKFCRNLMDMDFLNMEENHMRLKKCLDLSISFNYMALECMNLRAELLQKKISVNEAIEKYKTLLPMSVPKIKNIKYLFTVEQNVLDAYTDLLENMDSSDCIDITEARYKNYSDNIVERKRTVEYLEQTISRYSSYLGNVGRYDESTKLSQEGIIMSLGCMRVRTMRRFTFDIAWNHAQQNKLTDEDIKMCRCSYLCAWFANNIDRMKFYKESLDGFINMIEM